MTGDVPWIVICVLPLRQIPRGCFQYIYETLFVKH
jgi:hypothetical protein